MATSGAALWLGVEGFLFLNILGRTLSGCWSACLFTVAGTIIASDYQEKMAQYIGINKPVQVWGYAGSTGGHRFLRAIWLPRDFLLDVRYVSRSQHHYFHLAEGRPYHIESDESGFLPLLLQPPHSGFPWRMLCCSLALWMSFWLLICRLSA